MFGLALAGLTVFALVWLFGDTADQAQAPASTVSPVPAEVGPVIDAGSSQPAPSPQPAVRGPRIAIIMDDLGRGLHAPQALLSLDQPVAFAILPGEADSAEVAELAHVAGREVLLHIPMEPQDYPNVNPGEDALLVTHSEGEIRRRLQDFLKRVPHVTGVNNHMGSLMTENRRSMTAVMEVVSHHGLFMVDSRTTGRSVVPEVADRMNVPWLSRDVFLDNDAEIEAIAVQIGRLVQRARKQGYALGICHPYPQTLQALGRELPRLADQGVTVVPVAALLTGNPQRSGN